MNRNSLASGSSKTKWRISGAISRDSSSLAFTCFQYRAERRREYRQECLFHAPLLVRGVALYLFRLHLGNALRGNGTVLSVNPARVQPGGLGGGGGIKLVHRKIF